MPVLNVVNAGKEGESLIQVRWNNDDRGVVDLRKDRGAVEGWYEAARKWDEILRRQNMEYWAQLEPGRPLSKSLETTYLMSYDGDLLTRCDSL